MAANTKSKSKSAEQKKFRIPRGAIIEIVLLALELVNTLLPLPWRLIYPFGRGVSLIILKHRDNPKLMRIALIEIIFMTASILASFLPLPWRLIVPFITGSRSILIRYRHTHGGGKSCYCDSPDTAKKKSSTSKQGENHAKEQRK